MTSERRLSLIVNCWLLFRRLLIIQRKTIGRHKNIHVLILAPHTFMKLTETARHRRQSSLFEHGYSELFPESANRVRAHLAGGLTFCIVGRILLPRPQSKTAEGKNPPAVLPVF